MTTHAKLLRALHAEARRRGLGHEDIRAALAVESLANAGVDALRALYKQWTGKDLRRSTPLPKRGSIKRDPAQIIASDDIETLASAFSRLGWGEEARRNFIRRQLRGREQVRTVADFQRVFSGLRAIQRRKESGRAA